MISSHSVFFVGKELAIKMIKWRKASFDGGGSDAFFEKNM